MNCSKGVNGVIKSRKSEEGQTMQWPKEIKVKKTK